MRAATLSILGLYNNDNTVLDTLTVPDGVDADTIKENILIECAELTVVYQDPDFMKLAIKSWCKKCMPVWQKLQETLELEYNPLWNKDAYYEEDVARDKDTTAETTDTSTGTGTNEHDTAGFNSAEWANSTLDKAATTETGSSTGKGTEDENIHSTRREYGNIGVTTSMQLIKEQREVVEFNMMQRIIDDFKMRFCILVY